MRARAGEVGLELVSGRVEGLWSWHVSARLDELVWTTAAGERARFDGEMRRSPSEFQHDDIKSFVTTAANQLVRDGVDGALLISIEEATSGRRIGNAAHFRDVASLSGGFTYRSKRTAGQTVTVRMSVELSYNWTRHTPTPDGITSAGLDELPLGNAQDSEGRNEEQRAAAERLRQRWAFMVGMLELEAQDGSHLTLDAGTGHLDTVRITLDEGRGEGADERVVEWPGSWYRALAPDTLPSVRVEAAAE